jgi:hypothetical protein
VCSEQVQHGISGHIFDDISPATNTLSHLHVCPNLLEKSSEPLMLTYGPNDLEVVESILEK